MTTPERVQVYPRKLADGTELRFAAVAVYIPRRGRSARHHADLFSRGLWLAKCLPDVGREWAHDLGRLVADLLPDDVELVVNPPPSRRNRGFHFARALAEGVARHLQDQGRAVRLGRELRWADPRAEASKAIVHQAGKGRARGRVCLVDEEVAGLRVAIVDDLVSTGLTAAAVAEALREAGGGVAGVYCLGATERTEHRPSGERDRLRQRRDIAALRRAASNGLRGAHTGRGNAIPRR